ncbi:MAG: glycosyltransferase family 39 protein [Thermodesulfobacteriota bacterium]
MNASEPPPVWKRKAAFLIIGLLIAAGITARFCNLGRMVYWYDEAFTSLWISGFHWSEATDALANREVTPRDILRYQRISPDRTVVDTVRALADYDPHHPPLYYALVHIWAGLAGDSVRSVRLFSALAGVLVLPLIFWLCRVLFENRSVAWMAVALVAVSPFHILYAREARQYTLWMVLTLLSTVALLRAEGSRSLRAWCTYSLTVAAGLYVHLLFFTVLAAHGMYIGLAVLRPWPPGAGKLLREYGAFVLSSLVGLLLFMPWGYMLLRNAAHSAKMLSWFRRPLSPLLLLTRWGFDYSILFLDTDCSGRFAEASSASTLTVRVLQVFILLGLVYAVWFVWRKARRQTALLVLTLIGGPFLVLAAADFVLGGWGSAVARFLVPSYLGVHIAVAYLLATKIESARKPGWAIVAASLLFAGTLSCVMIVRADRWWHKTTNYYTPEVTSIINRSSHPLLITPMSGHVLSIAHGLHHHVRILPVTGQVNLGALEDETEVFFYEPDGHLSERTAEIPTITSTPSSERAGLGWLETKGHGP